jgi:hypothetical protein
MTQYAASRRDKPGAASRQDNSEVQDEIFQAVAMLADRYVAFGETSREATHDFGNREYFVFRFGSSEIAHVL